MMLMVQLLAAVALFGVCAVVLVTTLLRQPVHHAADKSDVAVIATIFGILLSAVWIGSIFEALIR